MSTSLFRYKSCILFIAMLTAISISWSADAIIGGAVRVVAAKVATPVARAVRSMPKPPAVRSPTYKPPIRTFRPSVKNPIPAIKSTAARAWKANFNRGRAQAAIARQVPKAKPINLSQKGALKNQFSKVKNPGVVYERYNPLTKKYYLGRAKSTAHYIKRQHTHNKKLIKTLTKQGNSKAASFKHDFHVIGTQHLTQGVKPMNLLRMKEESAIRFYKNRAKLKKLIENKRFEMNQKAYQKAGGRIIKSNG